LVPELKVVRELQVQLSELHEAARPFLTDPAREIYWTTEWESVVLRATTEAESNRRRFHALRATALISTVTLPALFIFNLSGTSSIAGRWLTFILSLIAATSTVMILFFRFGDRWFLYQKLSNDLMSAVWDLINSPAPGSDAAWLTFTLASKEAKSDFGTTYKTTIVAAAQPPADRSVGALNASVRAAVKDVVSGPALVDFDGWLGIEVTDEESAPVPVTEDREVSLRPGHRYNLVVTIATERPSGVVSPLRTSGGTQAATVEFSVVLDSDDPEVRQPAQVVAVHTYEGSARAQFTFEAREGPVLPWLWVRVAQRDRVVENLELTAIPASAEGVG
jgi:hypothetical protein